MYQKFNKSDDLYKDEIDIVNIINSMRQMKLGLKALLTKNQLKIIELANYKSLHKNLETNQSIVEDIIQTDPK